MSSSAFDLSSKQSFEQLFKSRYKSLVQYANRMVYNQHQCEDLVQQVFIKIWENREGLKIESSINSYLLRSVHNACLNAIKHNKVRQEHATTAEQEVSTFEDHLETMELSQSIEQAIEKLPTECKRIFLLNRMEGKKYREIADELDISIKTVENQMGKALRMLREALIERPKSALRALSIIFLIALVGEKALATVISIGE